jgi:flavin-binding protein dodecin
VSIAKIIELKAEGPSIEAAMENAVTEAGRSIAGIRGIYLQDAEGLVVDGQIESYRVNVKVTFVVDMAEV